MSEATLTPQQIADIRDRSKDNWSVIVGSEIRQLCDMADDAISLQEQLDASRAETAAERKVNAAQAEGWKLDQERIVELERQLKQSDATWCLTYDDLKTEADASNAMLTDKINALRTAEQHLNWIAQNLVGTVYPTGDNEPPLGFQLRSTIGEYEDKIKDLERQLREWERAE